MDRVLEAPKTETSKPTRPSSKEDYRLLFPGEKEWESWSLRPPKEPRLQFSTNQANLASKAKGSSHLAIPLQHLLILPIWLATTDASLIREMVALQLESRGLGGSAVDSMFDYVVVRQEKDRSLLSVSVLNENFPSDLCLSKNISYRPATDYWALPSNHLIVWKELSGVVLALTSGSELIYVQRTPGETLGDSLIYEAHCARLLLEAEGILPGLQGATALGSFSKEEMSSLQALHLPVQQLDRPFPAKPKNPRKLLPSSVHHARSERSRAQARQKFIWIGLSVYLLILAFFLGHLGWLSGQKASMQKEIVSHRQEAASTREAAERWHALELAILPETYPVEVLYRCTQLLPEEGIRFTIYDQSDNRILISGEAKNALTALQYIEALKKTPDLDAYEWEMPPPALLPNESAQFRIEGKRRDAHAQAK